MTVGALARLLLAPHRRHAALVVVLHAAATGVALAGPPLLGSAVDRLVEGRGVSTVTAAFLAVTVAAAILAYAAGLAGTALAERVLAGLRLLVVDTALARPVAVVEQVGTGDLLVRATADVDAVSAALRTGAPRLVVATLTVALTFVALVVLSPVLGAASLVTGAVVAGPVHWYLQRCGEVYDAERGTNAERIRSFHEGTETAVLVRAYGREAQCTAGQSDRDRAWFDAAMAGARIRVVVRSGVGAGIAAGLAAVLVVGAAGVPAGLATVGTVTAAVLYLLRVAEPVELLVHELDELQTARAAGSRIAEVVAPGAGPLPLTAPWGGGDRRSGLRATGLRFAYTPGRDVLRGIDLEVAPGERLALVGPSGAGKSTLARVLAGVHPPCAGTVALGGIDLTLLAPPELRRAVVVLDQEGYVFTGTVADNLRLVAPEADEAALRAALGAAGAWWVDELPDGRETRVGAGGHTLTPAQSQQLSLARMVLTDPDVVVLDEATAAFDAATAGAAQAGLDAALAGRTVVLVSHHLDTARRCDRIVVVDEGRIAEAGRHDDLVAAGGPYAALWQASSTT